MKISHEIPPIYYKCKEAFNVDWNKGVVITYGDTVYSKEDITPDLEIHEATHIKQQTDIGVDKWWERYFKDEEFRLKQETEAYINQYNWIKKNVKDRNMVARLRNHIIKSMVLNYGKMITLEEAQKIIK